MNLTLGSSWPMYQPLSLNRVAFPLRTWIGSVHRSVPCRTVPYLLLKPLQSSMFVELGFTPPAATPVPAAAEALAVRPMTPSWATTAMPPTRTTSVRHDRRLGWTGSNDADADPPADDRHNRQRLCMCRSLSFERADRECPARHGRPVTQRTVSSETFARSVTA